jgi:large subunit ribosomal protein L30
MADRLRVTQVKSTISHIARNRATVRALGLKRIGHTVEIPDNPATRGMVRQVRFLVSVEEVGDSSQHPAGAEVSARQGDARSKHGPSENRGDGGASPSHRSEDVKEKA